MPRAERRSDRSAGPLARAESRAREARERACGRATPGARRSAPATSAPGCGSWAGRRTREQPDGEQVDSRHHGLAARLLGILAQAEAEQGRTEYGLCLLDRAEGLARRMTGASCYLQRGLIFMRTWRRSDALGMLDEAVALLEGNPAETANLASALLNRSFAHLSLGDVRQARADLVRCQQRRAG